MALLSREDFYAKYGYDPEGSAVDATAEQQKQLTAPQIMPSGGGVVDHLKSAATGILSIPTDLLALPEIVGAGAHAAYKAATTDKGFIDQFSEDLQVDNARENTIKHVNEYAQRLASSGAVKTQEELQQKLKEYQDSKEFEDFTRTQLKGGPYVQATARNAIRTFLGDERPESQRSWTETAAEVVGGALVPGPAGWAGRVGAAAAARGGATNALINNPLSRGALKVAEITTPLTMPYTGTNVALNATIGVGIDQAVRAAQGKSTAFTPTQEDTAGIKELGMVAGAAFATGAFIAAVRGRANTALHATNRTARELELNPSLDYRTADPPVSGQSTVAGGPEQQLTATPSISELPINQAANRRIGTQVGDSTYGLRQAIQDIHGYDEMRRLEGVITDNTGAIANDVVRSETTNALQPIQDALDAMPNDLMRRSALSGVNSSTLVSHVDRIDAHYVNEIQRLQARINGANMTPQHVGQLNAQMQRLQTDLQRLRSDMPDARPAMPNVPITDLRRVASAFLQDNDPAMQRFKQAWLTVANNALDQRVAVGKMTIAERNTLRNSNPYYMPYMQDELQGLTGFRRLYRSISNDIIERLQRSTSGTSGVSVRESPIHELSLEIPQPRAPNTPETRITMPLHPMSAMKQYLERNFRDIAHTRMRNQVIRALVGTTQNPSQLVLDGHIVAARVTAPGSRYANQIWFTNAQLRQPEVRAMEQNPRYVPQWDNGRVRFWDMGDPEFSSVLRQDPVLMNGVMRGLAYTSRVFKMFTTGMGNPFFAPVAAIYDLMVGMVTHSARRAFGPMSYLAHRFLPAGLARHTAGRLIDPFALLAAPVHAALGVLDTIAYHTSRNVARQLMADNGPFAAMARAMGPANFQRALQLSLRTATMMEHRPTIQLLRAGAAHGSMSTDDIAKVRGAMQMIGENVPAPIRQTWDFYKNIVNSIYLAPKRMFFTENHALLQRQQRLGRITPQQFDQQLQQLIHETRTIAGDMSKVPASKGMRDLEAIFPYLTQTKLGTYHLLRNMTAPATAMYVAPRMVQMMMGVGASYMMMTYWDKNSRDELWKRTTEYDRYRKIYIPTLDTMIAWFQGKQVPFSRKAVYALTLPPDFTPWLAGMTAMMQSFGIIPSNATPKPVVDDLLKTLIDSLTPAMPPLAQGVLGYMGYKLDPQGADTRGSSLRSFMPAFRSGQQAEAASNLGEVSNSTSLMLNAMLGAVGGHLAATTDIFLHASKQQHGLGSTNSITPDSAAGYARGLRAAMGEFTARAISRTPDIPPLWQKSERYSTMTPAWQYVAESNLKIRSIAGMRAPVANRVEDQRRQQTTAAGGIAPKILTDAALVSIADDVYKWDRTGDYSKLKNRYNDIMAVKRGIDVNYNLPTQERQRRSNELTKQLQDNKQQQHLAIKYMEQQIAAKYGQALEPRLNGRAINMSTIDTLMRQSLGQ